MSRLLKLISDAIEALDLSPDAKTPVTKFDIMRIGVLIGHDITDVEANDCLMFLISHKALGARFSSELLTTWWQTNLGMSQDEALAPFQTTIDSFPSYPHTPNPNYPERKPAKTDQTQDLGNRFRKFKGPKPVKQACNALLEYLESTSVKTDQILSDPTLRHLVNECLMIIKENPTSKEGFQRAVESFQDTERRKQAKAAQEFATLSKKRLEKTETVRNQKLTQDVEFLMRNQTSANKGSAVYFLLTPRWKTRRRSPTTLLKNREDNKRVQRLMNNSAL